jgi:hypothetical protein
VLRPILELVLLPFGGLAEILTNISIARLQPVDNYHQPLLIPAYPTARRQWHAISSKGEGTQAVSCL